jgi:hypothetical protein
MERNLHSKIDETNDPKYTGVPRLVADDRILHLDGADLETSTHGKTASSAAFPKPQAFRSGCS